MVSCGPFKPKPVDLRKIPGNAKEKRERNIQEGRGFRITNPLGNKGGNFQFASSNEMWRASLELLDFTPLHNVDYSGGIIVTDWFNEKEDQDSLKLTVRFLSNEIRADGIEIIVHKKICVEINNCKIRKVESSISQEIKLAILKKAKEIQDNEIVKDPKYKISDPKTK